MILAWASPFKLDNFYDATPPYWANICYFVSLASSGGDLF